ncbi:MAG: NAD-dependent epimerase/dehydratase family protein [Desulfobacteraceae bacterium]|nr:NAD-dependent epimerase/dehydratase family protein [Desulfobacteraceae bacterium]
MKVLVTGATGFIGSQLCRGLIHRGYDVLAVSRFGRTHNVESLLSRPGFQLQKGDIRDADWLCSLVKENRIRVVCHLAAQLPEENNLENPHVGFDVNARGTLNVLNAAYLGGVEKFIYASSMSVYSEPARYLPVDESHPVQPSTVYGVSKLTGELCCNPYSGVMSVVVLRYSGVYGMGERQSNAIPTFIKQALEGKPITIHGDGTQTSDYASVDDVVPGTIAALEKNEPGVYNIGSGEEVSVNDLAKITINYVNPRLETVLTGEVTERPFRFVLDIEKARKTFGYSPRSLDYGICAYLEKFNVEV